MKIIELKVENIKKVKAVAITLDDSGLVCIGGENAQGKSSVLDALWMLFGGARAIPADPVHHGAEFGEIEAITDGDFVIYRKINPDRTTVLEVTTKAGAAYGSPQKLLDGFISKFSFDPLAFSNYPEAQQLKIIKELAGVDTTLLDEEIDRHTQDAKNFKLEIKAIEDQMSGKYRLLPEMEVTRTDTSSLEKELSKIMALSNAKANALNAYNGANFELTNANTRVAELEQELAGWKAKAIELHAAAVVKYNALQATPEAPDDAEIRNKLAEAAQNNEQAAIQEQKKSDLAYLDSKKVEMESVSTKLEAAKTKKLDTIRNAKLPIQGLTFDDNGIKFLGVPFAQASSAERLRVSAAMGFALYPTLKVLLIRDGSLLDKSNLKILGDMATAEGGQIWIERVGDGQECKVIMEDGEIRQ